VKTIDLDPSSARLICSEPVHVGGGVDSTSGAGGGATASGGGVAAGGAFSVRRAPSAMTRLTTATAIPAKSSH
jgi:hypothetical protein